MRTWLHWKQLTLGVLSVLAILGANTRVQAQPASDLQSEFDLPADFLPPQSSLGNVVASTNRGSYERLTGTGSYLFSPPQDLFEGRPASEPLVRSAPMFGDFLSAATPITTLIPDSSEVSSGPTTTTTVERSRLPLVVGVGVEISENHHVLPQDRIWVNHSSFKDFVENTGPTGTENLHRTVFGVEKIFGGGLWSIQARVPLVSEQQITESNGGFGFTGAHEELGNLLFVLKRILYETDHFIVAGGLGFEVASGSDLAGELGQVAFEIENEANSLQPWIGMAFTPDDLWFVQSFATLDVPITQNEIVVFDGDDVASSADFLPPTLLHLDALVGRWLFRGSVFGGPEIALAALAELHYTRTVSGDGRTGLNTPSGFGSFAIDPGRQLDIVNATFGLHLAVGDEWEFRVGASLPLRSRDNRVFDSEIIAAINYYF